MALAVVIGVISASSGGGGQRTVTTVVLDTGISTTTAPGLVSAFPIGAVLPATIDGWELVATDPGVVNLDLEKEGAVETAQATRGSEVGLLVGLRPTGEDGRVAVERIRDSLAGTPGGTVELGGIAPQGSVQTEGGVVAVTFGAPDRAVVAFAGDRDTAVSLAAAASEALGP